MTSPKDPGHPFHAGFPGRAAAALLSMLGVAYFVWWGCFAAEVPLAQACGGLCCETCQCCDGAGTAEPYCSQPGEACVFHCTSPGTFFACTQQGTGLQDVCFCKSDGTYVPGARTCDVQGASGSCFCPNTGVTNQCTCGADGTFDPCGVECTTPGQFFACTCPSTGGRSTCFCNQTGRADPCGSTCDTPGASGSCFCGVTGATTFCRCKPDGTFNACGT